MKLSTAEKKIIFVFIILGTVSAFLFWGLNSRVYPEINIDLKIDKYQAEKNAVKFLDRMGVYTGNHKRITLFSPDGNTKNYLDKHLSAVEAGALMNDRIVTWEFRSRFFIPEEEEEFYASHDNQGRLSGYTRRVPESKEGEWLEEEEALSIAGDFISRMTHYDIDGLELKETNVFDHPARRDYWFVWTDPGRHVLEAEYRVAISVFGDEITSFFAGLDIPENWLQDEDEKQSMNSTAQFFATMAYFIFIMIPVFVVLILKFRSRQLGYRFAMKVAAVITFISLLTVLNNFSVTVDAYSTLESWASFWAEQIVTTLLALIISGLSAWAMVMVGEAVFRERYPSKINLRHIFRSDILKQKAVFMSLVIGFLSGAVVLTYQMGYYYLGRKIGFWVPAEVNYDDLFQTYIPWIYVLLIGLVPAITEEVTFRLFGISVFKRISNRIWVIAIFTSLIWAFMHSAYPQQPFFARGLELLPVGIFFSWLYLRFGILTSITAHYSLNAALATQFLLNYNNIAIRIMSVLVYGLPLVIGIYMYILYRIEGSFASKKTPDNKEVSRYFASIPQTFRKITKTGRGYTLLPRKNKFLAKWLLVIGITGIFIIGKFDIAGPGLQLEPKALEINRYEVAQLAQEHMSDRDIDISGHKRTIMMMRYFSMNGAEFVLEKADAEVLAELYDREVPGFVWRVQYFRPRDLETHTLYFDTEGNYYSYSHRKREEASGAIHEKDEALEMAKRYLGQERGYNLEDYELIHSDQVALDNRTDYRFTFVNTSERFRDVGLHLSLRVTDSEITGFSSYIEAEDEWLRNRSKRDMKDFIVDSFNMLWSMFLIGLILLYFLRYIRAGALKWRESFYVAAAMTSLTVIASLNGLSRFFHGYDTSESLVQYYLIEILILLFSHMVMFFMYAALVSMSFALVRELLSLHIFPVKHVSRFVKEGLLSAYSFVAFLVMFFGFIFVVAGIIFGADWPSWMPVDMLAGLPEIPEGIDDFLPFLTLSTKMLMFFFAAPIILLPILALYKLLGTTPRVLGFLSLVAGINLARTDGISEGLWGLTAVIFLVVAAYCGYRYLFRFNILSVPVAVFLIFAASALDYWGHEDDFLMVNSLAMWALLLAPFLLLGFRRKK